jgi:hypothetical protein
MIIVKLKTPNFKLAFADRVLSAEHMESIQSAVDQSESLLILKLAKIRAKFARDCGEARLN